jgi:uncharacterized membrane protein YfcA
MGTIGLWIALVLSGGIGLSLGLLGGGGSIITVPVLVYVAGLPVREAVALSLAIVGSTAAVGAVFQARAGNTHWKAAAVFAVTGMFGAVLGAQLTPLVPPPVLMSLFAILMAVVGARMLRGRSQVELPARVECNAWKCGVSGLGLGVLTGFLGVGGGFLIVPALLRFAKLPMRQAVGTSLVIIAANSASGFASHLGDLQGGMALAAAFTAVALVGLIGGIALGRRMQAGELKAVFGGVALAVAAYVLILNIGPLVGLMAHRG